MDPGLTSTQLDSISNANIEILKNTYLLAFNQDDRYGKPAKPYKWGINPVRPTSPSPSTTHRLAHKLTCAYIGLDL